MSPLEGQKCDDDYSPLRLPEAIVAIPQLREALDQWDNDNDSNENKHTDHHRKCRNLEKDEDGSCELDQQQHHEQQHDDNDSSFHLSSMREKYHKDLLCQFYKQLMIPNFPLEHERDDLQDWILLLDPRYRKTKKNHQPLQNNNEKEEEDHPNLGKSKKENDNDDVEPDPVDAEENNVVDMDVLILWRRRPRRRRVSVVTAMGNNRQHQQSDNEGNSDVCDANADSANVDDVDDDDDGQVYEIVAGIALEYYRPSQVGLITYICVAQSYQRRGLMKILHPLALACLRRIHDITTSPLSVTAGVDNDDKDNNDHPPPRLPIRAILAETNTLTAGDAPPSVIAQRHVALHRLGYRQLQVPYVQPPLSADDGGEKKEDKEEGSISTPISSSFDEILLLVHRSCSNNEPGGRRGVEEGEEAMVGNGDGTLDSAIILDYVTDFYRSVYGTEEQGGGGQGQQQQQQRLRRMHPLGRRLYQSHWYYRVLTWFCHQHEQIVISSSPAPWTENYTPNVRQQWEESQTAVGIVGAGMAGLQTAVTLAQRFMRELVDNTTNNNHNDDDDEDDDNHHEQQRPRRRPTLPITIQIWEAHDYVGGRIRTIMTDHNREDDNYDDDYDVGDNHDELRQQYRAFAPWPIAMGAEFVHGARGILTEVIQENQWTVQETFDLSKPHTTTTTDGADEDSYNNEALLFLSRPETQRLSHRQREYGPIRVFGDGQLWRWDNENHPNNDNNNSNFPRLLKRAKQLWENDISPMADRLAAAAATPGGECDATPDMSLEEFVRQRLANDYDQENNNDENDIIRILQIMEAVYANTSASHNGSYGIHEASREESQWEYTEHNFRTPGVMADLVDYYLDQIHTLNVDGRGLVLVTLQTMAPVVRIGPVDTTTTPAGTAGSSGGGCGSSSSLVTLRDGTTHCCQHVVVTVPLAVLKAKTIEFVGTHAMPISKQHAINQIQMLSGVKVHLLLRCGIDIPRIPPFMEFTELVFCPGECCRQLWYRRNHDSILITAFVPANARDRLWEAAKAKMMTATTTDETFPSSFSTPTDAVKGLVLDQLYRMYNNNNSTSSYNENNAPSAEAVQDVDDNDKDDLHLFYPGKTPSCSAFGLYDWSDDEYVRGLYSSPSVGAGWQYSSSGGSSRSKTTTTTATTTTTTCRHALASPMANDTIFFAGEHTSATTCASVQAAMETGVRAADEVWNAMNNTQ